MVDREKVLAVLRRRFAGASPDQLAAAANAIVGLDEEWEEVSNREDELGYNYNPQCADICYLAQQVERGDQFRLFRRSRSNAATSSVCSAGKPSEEHDSLPKTRRPGRTSGKFAGFPVGTSLATLPGMSPVGRALRTRFEEVCRTELQRLRRKTASLAPEHREQVDALSVEVAKGIASRLDAAIETAGTDDMASVVMRLFAVTEPTLEERS